MRSSLFDFAHVLFGKPVSTPDQVRGRLFPEHALTRCLAFSPISRCFPSIREEPMTATQFRLVTRSDFDGLVCAVLLKELNLIDEIAFVHPKDMQDGKIAITARDITTNLPYVAGCHLAFDHHSSEVGRGGGKASTNHVIDEDALSA